MLLQQTKKFLQRPLKWQLQLNLNLRFVKKSPGESQGIFLYL